LKLIYFYKIEQEDKNLIYSWRKKSNVIKFLCKKKIDKSSHQKWFNKKLRSINFSAWTIMYSKKKIGLIQIDSIRKKKICNAGYYIAYTRYSYLTYEVMNNLHNFIFNKLKFDRIESYISILNKNVRKLNKMSGYKELKKKMWMMKIFKNIFIKINVEKKYCTQYL